MLLLMGSAALLALGTGLCLWNQLRVLDREALAARRRIAQLQELAVRTPQIAKRSEAYAGLWSEGSEELLRQTFFEELERLAGGGKLQMNLKPRPLQRAGRVDRLGVELELEATQGELLTFLDQLFAHPTLLELERLRIAPAASPESPLRATLLVNKIIIQRHGT